MLFRSYFDNKIVHKIYYVYYLNYKFSLDRRPRRDPCRGDAEGGGDVALGLARHGDNRLQLQRVADGDDPLGAPDPSDGVLRGRLPGLVDEQPAERLGPQ